MSENTGGTSRKRKAISATLAIAMAATMLLSGTLAYFYQSKAVNTFKSEKKEAYGHDDFIEGENKDVYVENTGGTDIYVRVKLEESFTYNGEIEATTVSHIPGEDKDVTKHDGSDSIHDHFEWIFGQEGVTKAFLSATSDQYKDTGDKVIETGEYGKVVKDNSGETYTDEDTTSNTDGVVTTAESKGVITMAEYIAMGKPTSATPTEEEIATAKAAQKAWQGWVMDKDGWVYWSQKVKPGQATGLLLDNVIVDKSIANDQYQYDIDVTFQAVDDSDIKVWTKGLTELANGEHIVAQVPATDSAITLLNILQGNVGEAAKIEEAMNNANSEGAKMLYFYALSKMNGTRRADYSVQGMLAMAESAEKRYNDSLKTDANGVAYHDGFEEVDALGNVKKKVLIKLNAGRTTVEENNSSLPDKLALDTVKYNFDFDKYANVTEVTKDLAMGITNIREFNSLSVIKATEFPSLLRLFTTVYTGDTYAAGDTELKLDPIFAKQIELLGLRGNETITEVNLDGYDRLIWFDMIDCTNLTSITNYPNTLLSLSFENTAMEADLTDPVLSELELLIVNAPTMNKPENLAALKNNKVLRRLVIGDSVTFNGDLDLSGMDNLIDFSLRNTTKNGVSKIAPISHIKLSNQAFLNVTEYICGGTQQGKVNFTVKNCTTLVSLDISTYTGLKNCQIDLTGCTGLTGVCRRYDQEGFKNYPTTADGIYERIVDAGGKNTYKLHKGSTVTNVTDPTKIAELDANNDMFSNGAA